MGHGVVVLSQRNIRPVVGWVALDEFEDILVQACNGQLLAPYGPRSRVTALGRLVSRLRPAARPRPQRPEADLLLVVARMPQDLRLLESVPNWRGRFRQVAAFILDSFCLDSYPSPSRFFDHIFVTTESGAELVRSRFGVPCSIVRQGMDCLRWASISADRSIDLLGMGRQPDSYHRAFQEAFHSHRSPALYLHSPLGAKAGPAIWRERPMLLKIMQRTQLLLAFHLLVEPAVNNRSLDGTMVTSRWLEGLTCGCVVLGKRPTGVMAQEMLNWPDSTFELPDNKREALGFVSELLADQELLARIRGRNVVEMVRRHDWRYRVATMLKKLDLAQGPQLRHDLSRLAVLAQELGGVA